MRVGAASAAWSRGLLVALATLAMACVKQPGADTQQQIDIVKREQTWEKLYERGRAFAAVGDYTRGEQYLAAALSAGGDGKKIVPVLMAVCIESQKYRVAIEYGDAHLKQHPDDVRLRHLIGTLYLAMGDAPQAKTSFEEVLRRNPEAAETHYALAVLYRDNDRDLLRADQHFRAYLRIQPRGPHEQDARASLLKVVP